MSDKPTTIDEYLAGIEPEFRSELGRIRTLVVELVPDADETMSYNMPTLKYKGSALVFFTASKKHMSFYPSSWAIDEFADRLADYQTTAHAIRFTLKNPLPDELITDLVRYHQQQIDEGRT